MDRENDIKAATIELLLREGKFGITINEIAEKSKVSRTVIHYYYRSKENLFSAIIEDIIVKYMIPRYSCLFTNENLKLKVENYLNSSQDILEQYPYCDVYLMTQLTGSLSLQRYVKSMQNSLMDLFLEIEDSISNNIVTSANADEFMADLLSMSIYSGIYHNFLKVNSSILFPKTSRIFFIGRKKKILENLFAEHAS